MHAYASVDAAADDDSHHLYRGRAAQPLSPYMGLDVVIVGLTVWVFLILEAVAYDQIDGVPPQKAFALLHCRGAIELLWKLWIQHGKLDTWRNYKTERILMEIFAKLLGLVIMHWELLLGYWVAPNRSMLKAT